MYKNRNTSTVISQQQQRNGFAVGQQQQQNGPLAYNNQQPQRVNNGSHGSEGQRGNSLEGVRSDTRSGERRKTNVMFNYNTQQAVNPVPQVSNLVSISNLASSPVTQPLQPGSRPVSVSPVPVSVVQQQPSVRLE